MSLSGELSQSERNHALQALRDGRARVCVATDVAARGIDLPNLDLVIHAELPNDAEVLQHRSGRTGRAGRKGISILLVPPSRRRRAEEMLGRARINAIWGNAPSADEIRKLDQERLMQSALLTEPGSEEDLTIADAMLQQHSARDIAAAFVKMCRAKLPAPEEIEEDLPREERPRNRDHAPREPREHSPREHKPREPREHTPREHTPREHTPRENTPHEHRPREHTSRDQERRSTNPPRERGPAPSGMTDGVWFRLNVGRERKADPKWLLPEICRQGELTKKDIGAIKVFDTETLFQIDAKVAEKFTAMVSERKKGGVRIMPAQDQTGISRARQSAPSEPAQDAPAAPEAPRKEGGFHQRKFGDQKPGGQKFGDKKFGDKKFGGKKFDNKRFDKKKPGGYPPKRQKPPSA